MKHWSLWLYPRTRGVPFAVLGLGALTYQALIGRLFGRPSLEPLQVALLFGGLLLSSLLVGVLTICLRPIQASFDRSITQAALFAAGCAAVLFLLVKRSLPAVVAVSAALGVLAHLVHIGLFRPAARIADGQSSTDDRSAERR
jgi:hypothetical protein